MAITPDFQSGDDSSILFFCSMKQKIWFLSPPVHVPTGGINNFYRLCSIAEELGIEAKVISITPYSHPDPQDLVKYWKKADNIGFRHDMFDIPDIEEGDIVVQPEIYDWKPIFSKKVRRVLIYKIGQLLLQLFGKIIIGFIIT